MIKKVQQYAYAHWFLLSSIVIVLVSSVLRFYNYSERWAIYTDQASFALLARYAFFHHKLPLLGQFTSAGPFQAGGEWYWFLMLAQSFYPSSILTPWVVLTLTYVLFVVLIIIIGAKIGNKTVGIVAGILAAVSPSQISQGLNLTNQSPLPLISLGAIWFSWRYFKNKSLADLFFLSFLVGLAPTFHPQGFLLMFLLFFTLLITGKYRFMSTIIVPLGLFIPWIPIFIADSYNHFFNTKNMISYYLYGQSKISYEQLGRSWTTYLRDFIPAAWSYVIGGNTVIGIVTIMIVSLTLVTQAIKKHLPRFWIILSFSLFFIFLMLRYTHTPLFDSYLLPLHPLLFLLTAYSISVLFRWKFVIGIILVIIIFLGSTNRSVTEIKQSSNKGTLDMVSTFSQALNKKHPNQKFSIYDYMYKQVATSQPLALILDGEGRVADDGYKIGIIVATRGAQLTFPVIYGVEGGYQILDLNSSSNASLENDKWQSVNPSEVYRNVQEWYKFKK